MRTSAPDPAVIAWLWSEEGISWASRLYAGVGHQRGAIADIKDDHECLSHCSVGIGAVFEPDTMIIKMELDKYGISGVPRAWHQEWLSVLGTDIRPDIRHRR